MSGQHVALAAPAVALLRRLQGGDAAQSDAAVARVIEQAHQAAAQARHAAEVAVAQSGPPTPPALPGEPKVTVNPDGRITVVSADGSATILYPDGRTTHVRPDGAVEQTGVPGDTDQGLPQSVQNVIEGFFVTLAFIAVGLPLARAFGRRLDRSAPRARAAELPPELSERMDRLEHAVDSIAVEVERISEGQRFTTKLMSELRSPASAALPGAAPPDGAPVRRAEPAAATIPASERRS